VAGSPELVSSSPFSRPPGPDPVGGLSVLAASMGLDPPWS
jgi:hypothetical protein